MTCAMTKTKGEIVYPSQWMSRTGLEEQIFADEPFPGVGLRTEDLDVPSFESFAPKESPPSKGASGLGTRQTLTQPATVRYVHAKWVQAAVEFGSFSFALAVILALLIAVTPL